MADFDRNQWPTCVGIRVGEVVGCVEEVVGSIGEVVRCIGTHQVHRDELGDGGEKRGLELGHNGVQDPDLPHRPLSGAHLRCQFELTLACL